ncbi:hypothetical protein LINGRAHAP2_LOCUS33209 [Linum grandiflorum]
MCSVSAEKSSSNWLDRLRSTKGFPTSGDLTLDHFLANPTVEDPSDSPKPDVSASNSNINSSTTVETSTQIGERDWFGVMNHVLSDLFVMGGPATSISGTKSARKQTNPKFFPVPPPPEDDKAVVAVAVASSFNSDHNSNINDDCGGGDDDDVEEEEEDECRDERCRSDGRGGGDEELKGYSRSEVTVIDTSYEVWKFDKLLFRRKNDWKVRDKKGRPWLSAATRKRKKGVVELETENGAGAKKKKAKVFSSNVGSSTVVDNGRNCVLQIDDNPQQAKMEGVSKEVANDLISQVPKHRLHGSSEVSEKLIRKKDVWKVRDKKGKSWLAVTKKKKKGIGPLTSENDRHGIAAIASGAKTKTKVFNSHVGSSTAFSNGRSCASPFDDNENERMEDVPREVANELISQVPKHRQVSRLQIPKNVE